MENYVTEKMKQSMLFLGSITFFCFLEHTLYIDVAKLWISVHFCLLLATSPFPTKRTPNSPKPRNGKFCVYFHYVVFPFMLGK